MKHLKKVDGHYLDMSKFGIKEHFEVYELGTYDFSENLDFGDESGVYIFTKRDINSTLNDDYKKQMYWHSLIYCGKTKRLDDRFCSHFHAPDIQKEGADRISIYKCDNEKIATELEQLLLRTFKFPVNEKDNDNPKYPEVKKVLEAF